MFQLTHGHIRSRMKPLETILDQTGPKYMKLVTELAASGNVESWFKIYYAGNLILMCKRADTAIYWYNLIRPDTIVDVSERIERTKALSPAISTYL